MKRFLGLLLACILVLSGTMTAFAADADKVTFELSGLSIVSPDSTGETVTRGEFAEMVVAILGLQKLADQMAPTAQFADVAPNAPYAKAVSLLSQIGIINGVEERRFAPDEMVSFEQAVKVLVVCTGYEEIAKANGGWSIGYTTVAAKNGFLNDVTASKPFARKDLYQLIYNALDVKLLVQAVGSPEVKLEKTGDTLRSQLMTGGSENVYKMTGTVTANAFSYTSTAVSNLRENEVVIDSVIYEIGNTNAYDLLGHKVEFFAAEKEDGDGYVLLYIRPAKADNVITLSADEFLSKSGNNLTYLDENDREKTVYITDDTKILYNGTRVRYPSDDLYDFENGSISFFDHDTDKRLEVVMIEEYVSTVAKSFNGQLFTLRTNCFYNGSNSLFVDTDSDYVMMRVTDAEGNPVESFTEERTISIYADQSGSRYKVVVSDKTVNGVLQMISEEGLMVENEIYPVDSSQSLNVRVGQQYVMYINAFGEAVFADSKHTSNYAFVMGVNRKGSLSGYEARMLLAGPVDFGVDVNEEDVNDTSQIPFLISQNAGVVVFNLAESVRIDGRAYTGDALGTQLAGLQGKAISYAANEAGQITAFDNLVVCGGNTINRSKYNVYEMLFGGTTLVEGFGITSDTQVLCIPNSATAGVVNPAAADDDCMVTLKIDVENNETGYLVSGYDYNENKKSARLLVIYADMNASQVRGMELTTSKASFISSVTSQYDEELGESKTVVNILNGSSKLTLDPMDITADNADLANIKAGDLVTYRTNNNGLLENVMILRSFVGLTNDLRVSNYDDNFTETLGTVTQMVRDEIDTANNVRVTVMTMTVNGTSYSINVPQRNKPPVYIYNAAKGTVESAAATDIIPGQERVYVLQRTGDSAVRAIVLIR